MWACQEKMAVAVLIFLAMFDQNGPNLEKIVKMCHLVEII